MGIAERVKADRRVWEIWRETNRKTKRREWWVKLQPGYCSRSTESHGLQALTLAEIQRKVWDDVVPCECEQCGILKQGRLWMFGEPRPRQRRKR